MQQILTRVNVTFTHVTLASELSTGLNFVFRLAEIANFVFQNFWYDFAHSLNIKVKAL